MMDFAKTAVSKISGRTSPLETNTDPIFKVSEGLKEERSGLVDIKSESEYNLTHTTKKIQIAKRRITFSDNEVDAENLSYELDNLEKEESNLKNILRTSNRRISNIGRALSNMKILALEMKNNENKFDLKSSMIEIKNVLVQIATPGTDTEIVCEEINRLVEDANFKTGHLFEFDDIENESTINREA